MEYLLRGILIGLLFGLPFGAVGALTVQRTWSSGVKAGLLTGFGSSVADCAYACIGAFGLTLISDFLLRFQGIITALGGVLILAMGLKTMLCPQKELPQEEPLEGGKLVPHFLRDWYYQSGGYFDFSICVFLLRNFGNSWLDKRHPTGGGCVPRDLFLVGGSFNFHTICQKKSSQIPTAYDEPYFWRYPLCLWNQCFY